MKTLLINPTFTDDYSVGGSRSVRRVLNVVAPLGLAYLAAVLEKNGFEVTIIDCTIEGWDKEIIRKIINNKPRIIGITATTPNFESAKSMAALLRESLSETVFVIGGAHITAMPYQAMGAGCFDIGVLGEAEETFLELVRHIAQNGLSGLRSIKGIIFRDGPNYIITSKREYIRNLDSIPFPARRLLPALRQYKPTPASYKKLPLATIMTSRGCPFQCLFCDRAVFGNTYRQRSVENILAEVDEVIGRYGAREIRFFDDLFTLDKERTVKICNSLNTIRIPWTCLTAVSAVTKELLREMRSAGCWQVLFGLESGDARMLALLNKGNTVEQNIRAVRWAQEAGLNVRADFIVGTPGETKESLERTLKFAIDMGLDYAHFNKFVPFPGTELYKALSLRGYSFDFNQRCSILDHSALLYVPEGIEKEEFQRFLDAAFKRFYLRPEYIIKRLLSIRTKDELIGQFKGYLAIAGL